jgi:tRNA A-37 threonylcarbamoyl transferase component Bud32
MPHAWRSPARSPGSPRTCATEPPAIRPAITRAFADRTPIDWDALLARVRDPRQRAPLDALRRLDALRGGRETAAHPTGGGLVVFPLALLVAVAALQILGSLVQTAALAVTAVAMGSAWPRVLIAAAFASAGLLLASASARDRRVLLLLATFTFAGSAFARAIVNGAGGPLASSALFHGLFPEAFVPAALWQFAVIFPGVRRFTAFDVWARRLAAGVWGIAAVLFLVNFAAVYGWEPRWSRVFQRDHPGNLFWHLFAVAALPAFATIFLRAHRSPPAERRKVVRLGCALAASSAPLLLVGIARLLLPAFDRWMLAADGTARLAIDTVVVCGLAAMPVLATLAVIVDRPFELPAIGAGSLRLRRSRRREWLTGALERLRLAGGPRDIAAVLSRELPSGVGAGNVALVARAELPPGSALPVMLEESPAPVLLDRDTEPFVLLPARDRAWLDARDVSLAAPIHLRNGTVAAIVLLGPRRGGGSYDRTDRWFIATLLAAAAAAWDDRDLPPEDDALECVRCGRLSASATGCACGGELMAARLPHRLAGKFDVRRRLGAGGMGVVYLAHDVTLGRDVALKTLPRRRGDAVSGLRDEARAMAALNHEALATIYGLEIWRGTPVLVVEYLAGGTLADRLARGALPQREAVALGVRLAGALAYMHERGLLHGDVKPGNIGFTADGIAKLLDFGLSDTEGSAAGTPGYQPPEAVDGAPADAAVDLWGLALVLQQASADADERLIAFFRRGLARARQDRFRSAREMHGALREWLE